MAKRSNFNFVCFRSGLNFAFSKVCDLKKSLANDANLFFNILY